MSDQNQKELIRWPENLPPPTEVTRLPPEHIFYRHQLVAEKSICDLFHDLYYFPEDKYFLYYEYNNNDIPEGFDQNKLENIGLSFRKHENFYYRRPFDEKIPVRYSYIRLTADLIKFPWQKELVEKGPMYGRVQIELKEWKKKEIELDQIKSVTSDNSDPLVLQPNFMGFGIDIKKVPAWFKSVFKKKV